MKIPMALVADDANISQEGKLNVLGTFDRIVSPVFPSVHPKMVFVFRIEAGFPDMGRSFAVRVRLMDADGEAIFEAGGDLVAPAVEPGDFATAYQVFTLVGIRFPHPGMYKFVINLDDLPPHETPLSLVQATWPVDAAGRRDN